MAKKSRKIRSSKSCDLVYSDGKSNKFWNIKLKGSTYTVTFGRVGTAGQTKKKSFSSASAAEKDLEKAVKEKITKGYQPLKEQVKLDAEQFVRSTGSKRAILDRNSLARTKQPKEWQQGKIVLSAPNHPVTGHGHVRVQFYLDRPKSELKQRRAFFSSLRNSEETPWEHPHIFATPRGKFISPEAMSLYDNYKAFWSALADQHLGERQANRRQKIEKERKRKKESSAELSKAAKESGFDTADLDSKLKRFAEIINSRDSISLAVEMLRAADVSLLRGLLSGAELKCVRRSKINGDDILWHPGDYFFPVFKKSGYKDPWEYHAPNSPAWILFWFALARCCVMKSIPKSVNVKAIRGIEFVVRNDEELAILRDILEIVDHYQQISIRLDGVSFDTDVLPILPKLKVLSFTHASFESEDQSKVHVLLGGLQRQSALEHIVLNDIKSVQIAEDQDTVFERVRFEQGSFHFSNLYDCSSEPPIIPILNRLDLPSAKVLIRMASDHSHSQKTPIWWRSEWTKRERSSSGWNSKGNHNPNREIGRIHLPRCDEISVDAMRSMVQSGLNLLLPAKCLSPENAKELRHLRSDELGIIGVSDLNDLPMEVVSSSARCLYVETIASLSADLSRRIAKFQGTKLVVACKDLDVEAAAELVSFTGDLHLASSSFDHWVDQGIVISEEVADILVASGRRIRFLSSDDDPTGRWLMQESVVKILENTSAIRLGDYRRRVLTKGNGAKKAKTTLQLRYTPGREMECVIITESGAKQRTSIKHLGRYFLGRFEKLYREFIDRGFVEEGLDME